ncbi:hypothetical protein SCANM63S_09377 [Streptomyces canarius]
MHRPGGGPDRRAGRQVPGGRRPARPGRHRFRRRHAVPHAGDHPRVRHRARGRGPRAARGGRATPPRVGACAGRTGGATAAVGGPTALDRPPGDRDGQHPRGPGPRRPRGGRGGGGRRRPGHRLVLVAAQPPSGGGGLGAAGAPPGHRPGHPARGRAGRRGEGTGEDRRPGGRLPRRPRRRGRASVARAADGPADAGPVPDRRDGHGDPRGRRTDPGVPRARAGGLRRRRTAGRPAPGHHLAADLLLPGRPHGHPPADDAVRRQLPPLRRRLGTRGRPDVPRPRDRRLPGQPAGRRRGPGRAADAQPARR